MTAFGKRQTSASATDPSKAEMADVAKGNVSSGMDMSFAQLAGLIIVLPLLIYYVCTHYGTGLVRDIWYANSFVEAPELQRVKAECRRHSFLLTECTIQFKSVDEAGEPTFDVAFAELLRWSTTTPVVPVRSTVNPSVVSIDYAVHALLS